MTGVATEDKETWETWETRNLRNIERIRANGNFKCHINFGGIKRKHKGDM
jgi:hypothetical protein